MKLIFLHGSPAVGKLTVAKALLRLVPARLMDNHAAIDLARTIFDFGAPGFWELVHTSRCAALEAAGVHDVPLVVMTFCYVEPEDRNNFADFEAIARRHGGDLLPVFLHCSREEAARRVGNPDRVERRKLTSAESLFRELDRYDFAPVPKNNCISFDSETLPPDHVAKHIVDQFGLAG
jgi:hypothetical protein